MTASTFDTTSVRRWKRYPEYRPSGAEWLPPLPAHWRAKRLKYLGHFIGGGTPAKENLEYWNGDIPWVSPKDMKSTRVSDSHDHITASGLQNSSTRLVPADSILVVARSGILKHSIPVAINVRPVSLNQDLKAVIPSQSSGLLPDYFSYLIQGNQSQLLMEWKKEGATVESLELELIANTRTPLPPLAEQRAITDFLDRETARIDALIGHKERLIALLEEKRLAVISHAVTRGLDPTASLNHSDVPWLGQLPTHWSVLALKRFASAGYKTFTDGDWIEAPYITDDGIRLIQTGNIGIGSYKEQGHRFISEDTFRDFKCTTVSPGDVLICRLDGPVGRACLAPDLGCTMITSVDVTILKPALHCDARYLVYVLTNPSYLEWVAGLCRVGGGFRLRVSRTMLGDFLLPMPPRAEQSLIADFLDEQTERLYQAMRVLERHISMMCEYRSALISAAVTGQIDVRGEV